MDDQIDASGTILSTCHIPFRNKPTSATIWPINAQTLTCRPQNLPSRFPRGSNRDPDRTRSPDASSEEPGVLPSPPPATMPAIRGAQSKKKTRRHTRDVDQVHADLASKRHLEQYHETKALEDLPGFGQWYCVECAKWYESDVNFTAHKKGKPHKRRVKQLKDDPYTQKDAEAAVGLTTDNGRRKDVEEMEEDGS